MSDDTIVAGAPFNDAQGDNAGRAYVFDPAKNTPPAAFPDSFTVAEGETLNVPAPGLLTNDIDADNNPLTAVLIFRPSNGQLTLNSDGSLKYVHDGSETTTDTFTYRASDGIDLSNFATVTITITPVNDAPVATDNVYPVAEGGSLNVLPAQGVLGNDTDAENDPLTAVLVTAPNFNLGQFILNTDGSFAYNHDGSETTFDSFTYKASDGEKQSNLATVLIPITPVNDAAVAVADVYNVGRGGSLEVPAGSGLLANDTDSDTPRNLLTVQTAGVTPAFGALLLRDDGSFNYTHFGGPSTTDSFNYSVFDGDKFSLSATVTINILTDNFAPVANPDTYGVTEGQTLSVPTPGVLQNDTDADNDPLTATVVDNVRHGILSFNDNGSFNYRHLGGEEPFDSFTYRANDNKVDSNNVAVVTITITPVNDPPVVTDDEFAVEEDADLGVFADQSILGNDTDAEGDQLSAKLVNTVAHGKLTLNIDGSFFYLPDPDFFGTDSFTYKANDGKVDSNNTATVSIIVIAVNDAPDAFEDSYTVAEGGFLVVPSALGVLANDSDREGDPVEAVLVDGVSHGTLNLNPDGSFTYEHDDSETLNDSFAYKTFDGQLNSTTVRVDISITPENDPPVALNDAYKVDVGGFISIGPPGVLDNDRDTDSVQLTATLLENVTRGTLDFRTDGSFTYTHQAGDSTLDRFTYKANDGLSDSNVAVVTIIPVDADIIVTKTEDTNVSCTPTDCSLREAIAAAFPGDRIAVPAGVYTLTLSSELTINKDLILRGEGEGGTIVQATIASPVAGLVPTAEVGQIGPLTALAHNRVFSVEGVEVTISDMTIRHGHVFGADAGNGGGIGNSGNLTLDNVTVTSNSSDGDPGRSGGGIWNVGILTLNNSDINSSFAQNGGGGIGNVLNSPAQPGILNINNSTIRNNVVGDPNGDSFSPGGGINNSSGRVTIVDSKIIDNSSVGRGGGILNGVRLTGVPGIVDIINSEITGNTARGLVDFGGESDGGGIHQNADSQMNIERSLISGNQATNGAGISNQGDMNLFQTTVRENAGSNGGGISNSGNIDVQASTISNNTGQFSGGGIRNIGGGRLVMINSTVSGNSGFSGAGIANQGQEMHLIHSTITKNASVQQVGGISNDAFMDAVNTIIADNVGPDCGGTIPITSLGHNLDGDGTCGLQQQPGDISQGFPLLGPLQNNGGPTDTHALLFGSQAIDATNDTSPFVDQRGVARPKGLFSDIGAYEFDPAEGNTPPVAVDDFYRVPQGATIELDPLGGVLFNDSDADGDPLTARQVGAAAHGQVDLRQDGSFTYTHDGSPNAFDTFSYVASDGKGDSNVAFVNLEVVPVLNVTVLDDRFDGVCDFDCTLRDAIAAAAPGQLILIPSGFITLDPVIGGLGSPVVINKDLVLSGPGADQLTIQAGRNPGAVNFRVFSIGPDAAVGIFGMTIRNGTAPFGADGGGGILNAGALTLGRVSLNDNEAFGANGGGIRNLGTLNVRNSSINENDAGDKGGGISNEGSLTILSSTVSNNRAESGGGIFSNGPVANLVNVTVARNFASFGANLNARGPVKLVNTILAQPQISSNCDGFVESLGHNLDSDRSCQLFAQGDISGVPAQLEFLQLRGGATPTHPLLPNSPAIDAGDDASAPVRDQRGVPRPQGSSSDIGAFELEVAPVINVTKLDDTDDGVCDSDCSLREATQYAPAGSRISIPPGTYILDIGRELFIDRDLNLEGAGADQTIIQASFDRGLARWRVLNVLGGNVDISGVTIRYGAPGFGQDGAGIRNEGTLTIKDSTITENDAASQSGGIHNLGTLNIFRSTISNNSASNNGGIFNQGGLYVENSTISGNQATGFAGGIGNFGEVHILNSTIANNTGFRGAGISNAAPQPVRLANTIIADNRLGRDCNGNFEIEGFGNLIGDVTECNLTGFFAPLPDILVAVDPLLGPLQNNGGPTFTHSLSPDSPAIDRADSALAPPTDQRGVPRPQGPNSDIGAFEFEPPSNTPPQANRDVYSVNRGGILSVPVPGVLINDFDLEGVALGAELISPPIFGQLTLNFDGSFLYIHNGGANVADFFTYSATDGQFSSNVAIVDINIGAQAVQVTKTTDTDGPCLPEDCSLRSAINNAGDGFTIDIPPGTYTLALGELSLNRDVTLSGAGANLTIIEASSSPFFTGFPPGGFPSGVIGIFGGNDIVISGVTIRGGTAFDGGGIFSAIGGKVTLIDSVVSGNQAEFGGGISNSFGTLVLENTQVLANTAFKSGGGVFNTGTLFVEDSTIANNISNGSGGGIENNNLLFLNDSVVRDNSAQFGGGIQSSGFMEVFRTQITGNTASFQGGGAGISVGAGGADIFQSTIDNNSGGDFGAGIAMVDFTSVFIEESTISNNSSSNFGGGIYNLRGELDIVNSTISGNNAVSDGGGLRNEGLLELINVTVTNNRSGGNGGSGIDNPSGVLRMTNTIVANNPDGPDCSGGVQSLGFNLASDLSCNLTQAQGDRPGADPLLDPLANNGGPTKTHALRSGSPAVDVIPPFLAPPLDQRGVPRPQGQFSDIGAFELKLQVNTQPGAADDSYSMDQGETLNVPAPGVLFNDVDPDGDQLKALLETGPAHGTLDLRDDGSFTYMHDGTETTSDGFTYRSNDGQASSGLGFVTITITLVNAAPVAQNDAYVVGRGGTILVQAPNGVLANDTDADPADTLTAIKLSDPAHGTLTLNPNGSFRYSHDGISLALQDSFTYKASDGKTDSNVVTVSLTVSTVQHLVKGRVVLEGRADNKDARVTFTNHPPVFTDADGNYEILLPAGTYDITVEKPGFLTASRTSVAVQADQLLSVAKLLFGDINGDRVVDVSDLAILALAIDSGELNPKSLILLSNNLGRRESPWE